MEVLQEVAQVLKNHVVMCSTVLVVLKYVRIRRQKAQHAAGAEKGKPWQTRKLGSARRVSVDRVSVSGVSCRASRVVAGGLTLVQLSQSVSHTLPLRPPSDHQCHAR